MSNAPVFYAYVHARPSTSSMSGIFYVGKGRGARHRDFSHRTQFHKNIVAKHGAENILIGKHECSDEATALDLERGLIRCLRRAGVLLANLTDGGEGLSGHRHSTETKAKMRAARLGKPRSAETRQKLREVNLGKPGTFTGKKHTEETRVKLSAARIGKPNPSASRPCPDEVRTRISATKLSRPQIECPHCHRLGRQSGAMARYHLDNCKHKRSQ